MLKFENISVKAASKEILKDVSFCLKPHTITAVIGKNASGKTTLVSCLTGEKKYTGSITYEGKDIRLMNLREKSRLISVLPQILPTPRITVKDLVRMGRSPYLDMGKSFTHTDEEYVEKALSDVGLKASQDKYLTEMSGGERQKAYIAMVLAQNTRVVVLDEPTTYMDMQYSKEFMLLLDTLKTKNKKTVLAVMHDINTAIDKADNILILDEGKAVFYGSKEECKNSSLIEKIFSLQRHEYIFEGEKKVIFR